MSYTQTPNYGLIKPIEGADADLWGGHINSDLDTLDTIIKQNSNAALPITGGVMLGPLTLQADPTPTAALGAATKQYVDGKVTTIYTPKGGYNAATNVPTLSAGGGGGVKGDVYTVTTAGTVGFDGVGACAVGDQLQNTGTAWLRVAYSTAFGTLAFVNANAVGALSGASGLTFTDTSAIQLGSAMMPDLVWWRRDLLGNIVQGLDFAGTSLFQALQVYGTGTVATLNATTATITSETFTTRTLAGVGDVTQAGNALVPDLARWVRGDNGQIVLGLGSDGDVVVKSLTATVAVNAPNISSGGTTPAPTAPSDSLDITAYGGVGDGADDVFLGTWTNGGSTLAIQKYSGTATWVANTLTLTGLASTTGPGFDPNVVGMSVYVGATDASGVNQTTTITGWTAQNIVTVAATPSSGSLSSAIVTWPAFLPADVGKAIRVEGGSTSNVRKAYNAGLMPWFGMIATVVNGGSVTVTGPVQPTFSSANNGRPTRVSWGTDNRNAYMSIGADVLTKGAKVIYHPRSGTRGKTVYIATALAQRGGADNYYLNINPLGAPVNAYQYAIWAGDPTVTGVLFDASGRLMPKRLVPARSQPPVQPPSRDVIARSHLPRAVANSAVNVLECGDSLAGYDPTNQSDGWYPANLFEQMLTVQNRRKTFNFTNTSVSGSGWAEMIDPSGGLGWVVPGTDLYYLSSGGNNDMWRMHPLQVQVGLALARGSGNDSGGRPPDIILVSDALKGDPVSTTNTTGYLHDGHLFAEVLLRSMAHAQGIALVDLSWQSEQVMHGASNHHRSLTALPDVLAWSLTPAAPFICLADCYSWSMVFNLSATNVWAAIGSLRARLSPMPGNELVLDVDPATSRVRYEVRLWGRSTATTVSTSGSTITTATGTSLPTGTLTWIAGQNTIALPSGGSSLTVGQCLYLPGLAYNGQHQRTYVSQIASDTSITVDDFWWGAPPGQSGGTFSASVTPVAGGQVFLNDDARGGSDVFMTWGTNSEYRGKITGYTSANVATLSPAPPALSGQAVQMWIGRASVPATVSSVASAGNSVTVKLSYMRDQLSVRIGGPVTTTKVFRGPVERWGNRYSPQISITGAGPVTCDCKNLYADRDVYYAPAGSILDIQGSIDPNYSAGGANLHDPSTLAETVTRRAYEALDWCLS